MATASTSIEVCSARNRNGPSSKEPAKNTDGKA